MQLSIRDEILFPAGYATITEGLRDLQISHVELWYDRNDSITSLDEPGKPKLNLTDEDQFAALKQQLQESAITVSALCMGNNFNAEDREGEIAWAVRAVHFAERLKIPVIRIDAIMQGEKDLPLAARQDIVSGAVQQIFDETPDSSVELGIENHGFQGNDPDFLLGLLGRVDSPRLGLTLDSGNFYWRGWPLSRVYEIFAQFAPVVKHTHIKNIGYPADIRETERPMGYEYNQYACPIHLGDIDHALYFELLQNAGYNRDLCLEDESLGKYPIEERKANLRSAADFFRQQIHEDVD